MAKYYRQQGETKKRKTLRIVRPIMLLIFVSIICGVGFFVYDIFRQQGNTESSSALTKPTGTVVDSGQTQQTPYFQFKLPAKWRVVTAESKNGTYVYRQFKGSLVEQDLTIEVNNSSQVLVATTKISRVMPIIAGSGGNIDIVNTGLDHCKKVTPTALDAKLVTMDRVTFPCNPGSQTYEIAVGLVGGTNVMTLPRPDGSVAMYKIHYRNLTFSPNPQDFLAIMKSFETK